jgi:hypothetical protein
MSEILVQEEIASSDSDMTSDKKSVYDDYDDSDD